MEKKTEPAFGAPRAAVVFLAAYLLACFAATARLYPALRTKDRLQNADRAVEIAVDIRFFPRESLARDLPALRDAGVSALALSAGTPDPVEALVRKERFSVVWRFEDETAPEWPRVREWDRLLFIDPPGVTARDVADRGAMIVWPDIRQPGRLNDLAAAAPSRLIKGHLLRARETRAASPERLARRVLRAVDERWVRWIYVEAEPSLSIDELMGRLRPMLEGRRYLLAPAAPFPLWGEPREDGPLRRRTAAALAFAAPLAALAACRLLAGRSALVPFLAATAVSIAGGLGVYSLALLPMAAVGVAPLGGVKLALVAPILVAGAWMLRRMEWRRGAVLAAAAAAVLALVLMRSGNFPLLPVTDAERSLRESLEALFGARPRFKEAFIGHPALLAGLTANAPALVVLGLIGQASIVNTFLHVQTPLAVSLWRTFHGVWIGMALFAGWRIWYGRRRVCD